MAKKIKATKATTKAKTKTKAFEVSPDIKRVQGSGEFAKDKASASATKWSAKQVAEHRALHHKVKVGKATFGSVYKAFRELGLPDWQHQAFRKCLKLAKGGKLPFKFEGKTYLFELVASK